jgi:hypothetical protein
MSFKIILRGGRTRTIAAEYECPVHGRFEIDVERDDAGDAPERIRCPCWNAPCGACPECKRGDPCPWNWGMCGTAAEWRISSPLARVRKIEAVKGKSATYERKTWTDTRNLGEGQPLHEWREDRAKIWEEKRKEDVMRFAREHNERVIGGD